MKQKILEFIASPKILILNGVLFVITLVLIAYYAGRLHEGALQFSKVEKCTSIVNHSEQYHTYITKNTFDELSSEGLELVFDGFLFRCMF